VFWNSILAESQLSEVNVRISKYELTLRIDLEHEIKVDTGADGCVFYGPYLGFIPGCFDECSVELDFEVAKMRCAESPECGGFVETLADMQPAYQYRHGPNFVLNEEGSEHS